MITLNGKSIKLRALELDDINFIYSIENDETIWHLSNTKAPYSKFVLMQYLKQAHKDIKEVKQLRLVISDYNDSSLGLIDIFDYDVMNKRAGLGIVIKNETDRNRGFGKEALTLLINYCFHQLNLHLVYCNILEHNIASLKLFSSLGFQEIGLKKDWNFIDGVYKNEYLLQLINTNVH